MSSAPRVRGAVYHSACRFVVERFDRAGLDRVLESLPAATRRAVDGRVDREAWMPFEPWIALLEAADRLLGHGDLALVRESGRWAAQADVPRMFPDLVRRGSLREVIVLASRFWNAYYDGGRGEALADADRGMAVFEAVAFPTPHRVHCNRVLGWIGGAFAALGGDVEMSMPSCRAEGGERCLFVARGVLDLAPRLP